LLHHGLSALPDYTSNRWAGAEAATVCQPWYNDALVSLVLHTASSTATTRCYCCCCCCCRVSTHRYHHLHCDTPLDPHSPYEGFFWSHMGWLFSTEASMLDYANADDLKSQWFYRWIVTLLHCDLTR
jgi:fatty-acid desaturase